MKDFKFSFFVTFVCVLTGAYWGMQTGMGALSAVILVLILGVMEVSLSFDNAVVNASVLRDMDEKWQKIFLTVGILIAVFGMRLVFPVVIVQVATGLSFGEVASMAVKNPDQYSAHLHASHVGISAFGGMFLLLIFFSFLFDEGKQLHWLELIEKRLAKLGKLDSISVMLALLILFGLQHSLPLDQEARSTLLAAGIGGVILFITVSSLDKLFDDEQEGAAAVEMAKRNGLAGFLYLEVLDASFSFDGVIGAFAITRDVIIIMLGLAIGAMFVRSLTVMLVRRGTLDQYVFLEHGAHYAIGALAIIMLIGITTPVPEVITGLIGVAFIGFALVSSLKHRSGLQPG